MPLHIALLFLILFTPNIILTLNPQFYLVGCNRFWSFERETQRPVPAKTGQYTQCTAYGEQDRVIFIFDHSIMHQQGSAVRINIGPGIFYFSQGLQDRGYRFIDIPYNIYERIIGHMFLPKFHLSFETGICFPQYSMPVTRYYFSFAQRFLYVFSDLFLAGSFGL